MNDLISLNTCYFLPDTTWPFHNQLFYCCILGKPEMKAFKILSKCMSSTTLEALLRYPACRQCHTSPYCIAIRRAAFQINFNPVVAIAKIPEQLILAIVERGVHGSLAIRNKKV